jgi:hypothetical protein
MEDRFEYYYNLDSTRNNLIYTSLISKDKKTFCQWYHNDGIYHNGENEVVDPSLMDEKFKREIKYLNLMYQHYPNLIPKYTVNIKERKIFLKIDGADFWNRSNCSIKNYCSILPNWQSQMIEIITAHKNLGIHKYSMHPSSYFIVDGRLKSINYFFTYHNSDLRISIKDVESHISNNRKNEMKKHLKSLNISWDEPQSWETMDKLCWNSFRTNYPEEFIIKALKCIV